MPVTSTTGHASFSRFNQRDFIDARGCEMVHSIGIKCPCRNEDVFVSMANDGEDAVSVAYHALCQNERWLYFSPQSVTGLVTAMSQQLTPVEMGWAQPGDLVFSPQLDGQSALCEQRTIGQWDRLTATWPQPLDGGQVIVRGAATAGQNRQLRTGLGDDEDRLWYEPQGAIWCVDFDGKVYVEGDFILGPGKRIRWPSEKRPRAGMRYALKYNAILEWIAVLPPVERYDGGQSIGQKVLLRKLHVERLNQSAAPTTDATMARSVI